MEDIRHEWLLVEVYQNVGVDAAQPLAAGGAPKSRLLGSADILFAELLAPPGGPPWTRPLVLDTPNLSPTPTGECGPLTLSITAATATAQPIPSLAPTPPPLGTAPAGGQHREQVGVQSPYQRHFVAVQTLVTYEYTSRGDLVREQEQAPP